MTEQPQSTPVNHELVSTSQSTPFHGRIDNTFASLENAIHTDQYEVARGALEGVRSLRSWRQSAQQSSFSSFYNLIEAATDLNKVNASPEERAICADRLMQRASALSPRVRDLYLGLLSTIDKDPSYAPQFEMTQTQLDLLAQSGDLAALHDSSVPWDIKLNRMKTRIETELRGRKALDRRDKEKQKGEEQETPPQPTSPPSAEEESKPSMDEMERLKEGEQASAIWTITPAYGGYYKEQSFDVWDSKRNTWKKSTPRSASAIDIKLSLPSRDSDTVTTVSADLTNNQWARLPLPYTRILNKITGIQIGDYLLQRDENGDYLIGIDSNKGVGQHLVRLDFAKNENSVISSNPPKQNLVMPGNFSQETETKLAEITHTRRSTLEKARALGSYTMRRLQYSNDSAFNALYENHPDGYIGAIDQLKKADCDVSNTYYAALCARLGIMARHVVGHMVKGKDTECNARITSGTGHAWTEVWDTENQKWVRMDATPPGDPNMEEDQSNSEGGAPGDYGEQEAIGPTDKELEKLEKRLEDATEKLSYTEEEREISKAAGIELKEARDIVKEIREAEEARLPNGERIVDVLAQVWTLVTRSRTTTSPEYTGPLRKQEGGESIEDIVAHSIGIQAGESDPLSRQKEIEEKKEELVMSTMQVLIGADKSGSMGQTVDGQTKWALQRKVAYLLLSSLDRAQKNLERAHARLVPPLKIETEVASFKGEAELDIDKPLSSEFSAQDKVLLWRSLSDQGYGNGDMALLTHFRNQIIQEELKIRESGKKSDTLRVLFACSDGEPDDSVGVRSLATEISAYNTTVVGVGLTETAAKVPIIYNTPTTHGDLAKDINDLPAIVVKHFIAAAVQLIPPSRRPLYQKSVANLLAKFNLIGVQ